MPAYAAAALGDHVRKGPGIQIQSRGRRALIATKPIYQFSGNPRKTRNRLARGVGRIQAFAGDGGPIGLVSMYRR